MEENKKRFGVVLTLWIAPLLVSLVAGIVVWMLPDNSKNAVWSFFGILVGSIWSLTSTIVSAIAWFLNLPVPVWGIIVGLALLFLTLLAIDRWQSTDSTYGNQQIIREYSTDNYKNWKFKWQIGSNRLFNLRPVCRNCECEIVYDEQYINGHGYSPVIKCPNCDTVDIAPDSRMMEGAEKVFIHRYNTGEWKRSGT